jgi:hypothetical protein
MWVRQWRKRHAIGDVIVVRYADDWLAGFQYIGDAQAFQPGVAEQLKTFGLRLHPDKTRLIEFGRYARGNVNRRGAGTPQTFDFLGFTRCCGQTKQGRFKVTRLTSAKRLTGKLQSLKMETRKRMHRPITEQGNYLKTVVGGHGRYFGVPASGTRLMQFRREAVRIWRRTLSRRSQSYITWARMYRLINHWLPTPKICHPCPGQRLIVNTQGRSRIR